MSADRSKWAADLAREARKLDAGPRRAFLDDACGDDDALRAAVEALLVEDAESGASGAATAERETAGLDPEAGARGGGEPTAAPPTLPDYELLRPIGRGGLGEVWLGRNHIDLQYCAIKLFREDAYVEIEGLREYKRRVTEHPHLAPIEHVGEAGGSFYYVMPLADDACGTAPVLDPDQYEPLTLERHAKRQGKLVLPETLAIGRQLLSALAHLHQQGARHGDVKPSNILRVHGRWQLADHGLVSSTERGQQQGCTPDYCPPEGPGGPEADLYALGVTLFEVGTGNAADQLEAFLAGVLSVRGRDPATARFAELVRRACAPEASQRFSTAVDMLEALDGISPAQTAAETWWRRWAFPVLAAVVVVSATVVGTVLWLRDPAPAPIVKRDLRISRFNSDESLLGVIGINIDQALEMDWVTIEVAFEQPTYCYLVAFNPDGSEKLCFPGNDGARPHRVQSLEAPITPDGETAMYGLTDGAGLQAFVLIASSDPLPAYRNWRDRTGALPWQATKSESAWVYADGEFVALASARGPIKPRTNRPAVLQALCKAIEAHGEVDLVRATAFPVVARADAGGGIQGEPP